MVKSHYILNQMQYLLLANLVPFPSPNLAQIPFSAYLFANADPNPIPMFCM